MKSVLLLLLLTITTSISSQETGDSIQVDSTQLRQLSRSMEDKYSLNNFEVTFPTPESYKFMKYGMHEPFLATGTVNVSIPFYEIKVGNFSLPIAMQYATNGIKPEDTPHPIGYGWILQPALRITRIMMGRDDFKYSRNLQSADAIHERLPRSRFLYLKSMLYHLNNERFFDFPIDSKIDIFTAHLPNERINFVIERDNDKWIGVTDGSFAKIEVTEEEIIVKDENGITYIFGGGDNYVEKSVYEPEGNSMLYISTWGLRKIVLPNNNELLFSWEKISSITKPRWGNHSVSLYDYHSFDLSAPGASTTDFVGAEPIIQATEGLERGGTNNNILLKSISFPQGKVTFSYLNNQNVTLDKIEVYAQTQQTFIDLIKKATFEYDTYGELLNDLIISDEGRYTFEYNAMHFIYQRGLGPTGFYPTQDYWGYNNGALNTASLVPKVTVWSARQNAVSIGKANREVDDTQIQANLLKKVTYPLGGTTEFKYETHRFLGRTKEVLNDESSGISVNEYQQLTKGGGVRLTQMITKESEAALAIVKTYKYGECQDATDEQANLNSTYSGNGFAPAEPTLDTFVNETWAVTVAHTIDYGGYDFVSSPIYVTRRVLNWGSKSYIENYMLFSPNVWYKKVTEYINEDVKTVYEYNYRNPVDEVRLQPSPSIVPFIDVPSYPRPNGRSFFQKRIPYRTNTISTPNLKRETKYEKQESLFRKIEERRLYYNCHISKEYNNLEVVVAPSCHIPTDCPDCYCPAEPPYFIWSSNDNLSFIDQCAGANSGYGAFRAYMGELFDCYDYKFQLAKLIPTKEVVTTYNTNGTVINTLKYDYTVWGNNKVLKSKSNILNNLGDTLKEEYLYPWEDLSELTLEQKRYTQQMILANRMTTPIQSEKIKDNCLIEKKIVTYKDYGNGLILPQRQNYTTLADTGQIYITYHNYDHYGNPLYITKRDMLKTVYLWSYRGQYPVAEIKNVSLEEVKSQLESLGGNFNSLSDIIELSESDWARLNLLRTAFPNAQVTTYKYKPLVGVSSIIDATGMTTYYEYDNRNRLIEIYQEKNGKKEILKQLKYQIVRE